MTTPRRKNVPTAGKDGRNATPRGTDLACGATRSRLAGRRILLTRSEEDSAAWARELERIGAVPVTLPCIDAEPIGDAAFGRELRDAARAADWLVFTSRRGVDAFVRLAGSDALRQVDARESGAVRGPRIAVVGPATAKAATRLLGRVDLVAEHGTAESLAESMISARVSGARVVLALAENARDVLETRLRAAGAECRRFDVYRTVPAAPETPKLALSTFRVDAVWLASPSAVEGFANRVDVDSGVPLVAIGPSTAAAIRERGLVVAAEASTPSFEGLLEATR